jgi:hypothetical protein
MATSPLGALRKKPNLADRLSRDSAAAFVILDVFSEKTALEAQRFGESLRWRISMRGVISFSSRHPGSSYPSTIQAAIRKLDLLPDGPRGQRFARNGFAR